MRKALLLFALLLLPALARAATVTIAWDANASMEYVVGYRLYWGPVSRSDVAWVSYPNVLDVGGELQGTATVPDATVEYFAVTAYDGFGNESDYSTEVVYDPLPMLQGRQGQGLVGTLGVHVTGVPTTASIGDLRGVGWIGTLVVGDTSYGVSLSGVSGTGQGGTLTVSGTSSRTVALTGVSATGQRGTLGVQGGVSATATLTGRSGTASVGTITPRFSQSRALSSLSGTSGQGTLVVYALPPAGRSGERARAFGHMPR